MISIVSNNLSANLKHNNIRFKSSMNTAEKNAVDNQLLRKSYKEQQKAQGLASIIGLGAGAIVKLAGKEKPLNKGIEAYFASLIALFAIQGLKETNKKVDFGGEEKTIKNHML